MTQTQLNIIAPDRRIHAEAIYDLVGKVFSYQGYYRAVDVCRRTYFGNSHYDWEASRIGLMGDRIITHYGVWDYQMRVGSAFLRTGGIGAVATDDDFRKQGLMAQTASASINAMRECGYDVSILFGIDDFYHRFGYVRAWSDTTSFVNVADLPKEKPPARLHSFKKRLNPALLALYNKHYASTTGTAVRPTYANGDPWGEGVNGVYWVGADGTPVGYVLIKRHGSRLTCTEQCGDADEVLRVLASLGRKWHCEDIEFRVLPYDTEVAQRIRWGNCKIETTARRNGAALIVLLNLTSALTKMQDELSRRLQASPLAKWRGDLAIVGAEQAAMLHIRNGEVTVVRPKDTQHALCGEAEIVQLLIGTDEPREVMAVSGITASGDAAELATVLFPNQHPVLGILDHY